MYIDTLNYISIKQNLKYFNVSVFSFMSIAHVPVKLEGILAVHPQGFLPQAVTASHLKANESTYNTSKFLGYCRCY